MSLPNEVISGLLSSGKDEDTYQVSRSLRFNSADSPNLNRTFGANPADRKKMTLSLWLKRSRLGGVDTQWFFGGYDGSSINSNQLGFTSGDKLISSHGTGSLTGMISTQVFRDTSAWYHFVFAYDMSNATTSNRVRVWVNGTQITTWDSTYYPDSNLQYLLNNANNRIGSSYVPGQFVDAYLAQIHCIDGQVLDPTSFAESDANGRWVPKAYTGTYGTNGFYLNFSDNSGTTSSTLGKDSSGNGNDWTPNNFSVTAGVGNDSLVDSPTNYGTDTGLGGEVRGNFCTLDSLTPIGSASSLSTLSNGNLQLTWGSANYSQRFGNIRLNSGKWYFEWTLVNVGFPGLQCGWHSSQNYPSFTGAGGQATGGSAVGYFTGPNIGVNTYAGGFAGVTFAETGWTANDIVMIAIDFDSGKFWGGRNGTWYQSGNPSTGANALDTWTPSTSLLFAPWFVAYGSTTNTYVNFGQRPFAYTAPTGFKALCTQNLPTPSIKKPSQYMNVVTYTGNGSTRSITGVGFQPDLVWIKNRDTTDQYILTDAVRGPTKYISSDGTDIEVTDTETLATFDADGFTVGNNVQVNTNTENYVAWCWKAGGSGSSDTNGTISSTVSANPTAGFSIVKYVGNGTGGATVGHGLGAVPAMIIVKNLDQLDSWAVYHKGLADDPETDYIRLDLPNAKADDATVWNDTAPTSTVFSVGTSHLVNASTENYIAYCFAEVDGFSRFGHYISNGNADGPFIWCGFRPKFVLTKNTEISNEWFLVDAESSAYNPTYTELRPSVTDAERTTAFMDILSNGFKLRLSTGPNNAANDRHIFIAFAEALFAYARAR